MATRKYSPLRKQIINDLADALAALRQQEADDYNPGEWADGTRFGYLTDIDEEDAAQARVDAEKIVLRYERENFWPAKLQDLGLFLESLDQYTAPEQLTGALAMLEVRDESYLLDEELELMQLLQKTLFMQIKMIQPGSGIYVQRENAFAKMIYSYMP